MAFPEFGARAGKIGAAAGVGPRLAQTPATAMHTDPFPPVLQVIAPPHYGGLGRVVSMLTRGFVGRGRSGHVLAFVDRGDSDHPLVHELRAGGVPTTCVEVPPRAYGSERAHLRRVAREVGARIVHTHGARVDVVDGPAARRLGLGTVTTLHGFTGGGPKNRFYEWLQVRAVRRSDAVVAVSRPMADRLRVAGVPAERLWTLPNAWSPGPEPLERSAARAELGLPLDGFRIGWVGRLTAEKGADVLVEALPLVEDLPAAVSVIGDGRQQASLKQATWESGLGSRVTWHGAVTDASRYMRAFDAFVLSSRTEGTPIALFEAIAAGVPVVATAVGGVPDVVTEREALLVPPEHPAAIAAAVREVHADVAAARRRARAALARVTERFALDPWLDAYEQIYRTVAAGARPKGSG